MVVFLLGFLFCFVFVKDEIVGYSEKWQGGCILFSSVIAISISTVNLCLAIASQVAFTELCASSVLGWCVGTVKCSLL